MSSSENSNSNYDSDNDSPEELHIQNTKVPQTESKPETKEDEARGNIPAERQGRVKKNLCVSSYWLSIPGWSCKSSHQCI